MQRKKFLGQCFLESNTILEKEAKLAEVTGKNVLEIGPGDGRLTKFLLKYNPSKLTVIEKDPRFQKKLSKLPIEVIIGDFLTEKLPVVDIVVGNIPYYISSDIIFKIRDNGYPFALLMVQKEFAKKMIAKPGESNYGRLSVTSQICFKIEYVMTVASTFFKPEPKVDSAIIILTPTGKKLSIEEENTIRYLFSHKNKTVKNALRDSKIQSFDVGEFAERRVSSLTLEEILQIASIIK